MSGKERPWYALLNLEQTPLYQRKESENGNLRQEWSGNARTFPQ